LLKSGDDGTHVDPSRMTVAQWIEHWLSIGAPNRKKKTVGRRSMERYQQFLRLHVIPHLGAIRLQKLNSTDIERLYEILAGKMAPNTHYLAHSVFAACLNAAVRKELLASNPIAKAEKVP